LQIYYDGQLKKLCDSIEALESRVEQLEASKERPQKVEADVFVTKDSLKKVRNAIMNIFR